MKDPCATSQNFFYSKELSKKLCLIYSNNNKVYFGVYDKNWLKKRKEKCHIFDAGTNRFFRQEVLRKAYIASPEKDLYSLSYQVAKNISSFKKENSLFSEKEIKNNLILDKHNNKTLLLNYKYFKKLQRIKATEVLEKKHKQKLRNKIVIIGNKSFRKRTIHHREGSHVNTPWEGSFDSEKKGKPILYIYPIAINNLLKNNYINKKFHSFDFLFFFLLFCASFYFWLKNRILALLYGMIQIFFVIAISLYYFTYHNTLIDITNFILFSYLGSFIGSFAREKRHILLTEEKNKDIIEKVNMSIYDNKVFSKIIKETDQFIQKAKIILYDSLEKKTIPEKFSKEMKEQIANLSANTQDTCNYLKVLDIEEPTNQDFSIIETLEKTILTLKEQIQDKNINLKVKVTPHIKAKVDQILFQAILYNILSNAIKYTFPSTTISIEESYAKGFYSLLICDQGPGFKKKNLEDNILHYNKSKKEELYSSNNYGLGLYLSYLISKKIGVFLSLDKNSAYSSIIKIQFKESQISE